MPNAVGPRGNWGVIIPSTSTTVEHDFAVMRPAGITFHAGRSYIERIGMQTDAQAIDVLDQMDASRDIAIRDVMTVRPDHLVVAMSAEIIRNGAAGAKAFVQDIEDRYQVGVTTGPTAVVAGLQALGAHRIAVLSPYQPVSDERVVAYMSEVGIEVVRIEGMRCASALAIAEVSVEDRIAALRRLDGPDVDAIVQVGTNLPMVDLAGQAETWLGKPVLAMNSATLWHALRNVGYDDRYEGYGTLLRDH